MTREDIKKQFPDATDDQLKALLDIHTADIGKAIDKPKGEAADLAAKLKTAQDDLATAQDTIADLETNKGDVDALQKVIDDYKAADEQRIKDQAAAEALAKQQERFSKALGDRKFAHDYISAGVFSDFQKALEDKANEGKSDAELFDALTKDKEGIFQAQSIGINMGLIKNSDTPDAPAGVIQTSKELNKHRLIK